MALEAVILAAAAPAAFAARVSRAAGVPLLPDPLGGFCLALPQGRVRVLGAAAVAGLFPGLALPALPAIVGIELGTDDGAAAAARLASVRPVADGVLARLGGVAVKFLRGPV